MSRRPLVGSWDFRPSDRECHRRGQIIQSSVNVKSECQSEIVGRAVKKLKALKFIRVAVDFISPVVVFA